MNVDQIVALMIDERDRISRAIAILAGTEKSESGKIKPSSAFGSTVALVRKGRTVNPAQRAEAAARMKKYWAKRRKGG